VCDKRGDPCDPLCGGAGCGICGGLSCEHGAVTKADRALGVARDAEKAIREKETDAEELLRGVMLTYLKHKGLAQRSIDTAVRGSSNMS